MTNVGATGHTEAFDRLRPYLLRVAYSHLGVVGEAEDVVQEAWLRLHRVADPDEIRDLRAWLTTTVSRLALDALTSARARRETYVGTWLPEPIVNRPGEDNDPLAHVTLDESVSMALLVVLETLTPAERTAFLLHDVFGYSFSEVAKIVGRRSDAVRQLAARARRSVQAHRPRYPSSAEEQRHVVKAFLAAASAGELTGLIELLDPEVSFRSDGGGLLPAAGKVFVGVDRVGRILAAMAAHYAGAFDAVIVDVNGAAGLLIDHAGELSVVALTVDGGRIREIDVIRNPHKLRRLPRHAR